jgi:hypothetical protein
LQAGGQGFESPHVHQSYQSIRRSGFFRARRLCPILCPTSHRNRLRDSFNCRPLRRDWNFGQRVPLMFSVILAPPCLKNFPTASKMAWNLCSPSRTLLERDGKLLREGPSSASAQRRDKLMTPSVFDSWATSGRCSSRGRWTKFRHRSWQMPWHCLKPHLGRNGPTVNL